jgi:Bacterial regulatory proteins, luxR family
VELPAALEDLAVVLAERGQEEEARTTLNEAVSRYDGMQARWDIRRAEGRLRPYGIRRGVRGQRGRRAASGWEALTPTEVKIAALVARGDSTSDIAGGMFLSRRTVQTYISFRTDPGACPGTSGSADDSQGEAGRTASLYQPGDLVPVDAPSVNLGQRCRDAQAPQLGRAPVVHRRLVMLDRLVPGAGHDRLHRSAPRPHRFGRDSPGWLRHERITGH